MCLKAVVCDPSMAHMASVFQPFRQRRPQPVQRRSQIQHNPQIEALITRKLLPQEVLVPRPAIGQLS